MAESEQPHRGLPPFNDGMSAVRTVFPQNEEAFPHDIRVSFDAVNSKYILKDDDGKEYEWEHRMKKWIELADQALLEQQASVYRVPDDGEGETAGENKKRKRKEAKPKKTPNERVNSSIYVSNLPSDTTIDEIHDRFKKYGLIANNVDSELPRIKMYADDDGVFKGDALITYFRPESIDMAILMSDKTDFRGTGQGTMRVQEADMSYKKMKEVPADQSNQPANKRPRRDVEKIKRLTNEMNARLADWSDDEDPQALIQENKPASKFSKIVVVKHFFTLTELTEEPEALDDLREDLYDQAKDEEWGEITKLDIYDLEPDGIVVIRFSEADSAQRAIERMDGRWYAGRQLEAFVPDRKPKYKMSKPAKNDDAEDELARLQAFGRELDAEGNEDEA